MPVSEASPPQGAGPGLRVEGLRVRYGPATAIEAVDLSVPPGGRVALVGRNGAGKSTLLKAIAGSVPAAAGRLVWDGQDLAGRPLHARVRAGICLVPEGRRTFASLSVADNLRVGGFVAPRQARQRQEQVYQLFPVLAERASLPAAQLSGGEAQMLAIGHALMSGPRLVLLDEPSIGLAPVVVERLLETMGALSHRGIAVLLVEQSVRLAGAFADSLYVLHQGRSVPLGRRGQGLDEDALRAAYFGQAGDGPAGPLLEPPL